MSGQPDLTDRYNTPLTPAEEQRFQEWARQTKRQRETFDYDLRGAWKADAKEASNGHLPDTFKKPNHPTFSDESQYNGKDGAVGGKWAQTSGGKWVFRPSETNIRNFGVEGLQQYFKEREPDAHLMLPLTERMYPKSAKRK